ncbi:predicted protein [Plenodomus lingam JN3]|uniref:Predicted protein n=1 Tax=Leptosphaeria maculans (strain JN3 / isolate v23.1.3 / race Av1-4-5-6-7-8) TaxID=985895 RepID=E5A5J6_LEPMJ|nr:predicted protein [Plenodomus lingam JN3]CBX98894.1 predicted protein [Plenodomus lingam JN3]
MGFGKNVALNLDKSIDSNGSDCKNAVCQSGAKHFRVSLGGTNARRRLLEPALYNQVCYTSATRSAQSLRKGQKPRIASMTVT